MDTELEFTPSGWRRLMNHHQAPAALIALLVILLYLPVCGYEFQAMDDGLHVYDNPHLVPFAWGNLLFFWQGAYQGLYIPVTYDLWAILAGITTLLSGPASPLSPTLFHAGNLLLHLGNALLVWRILKELGQEAWAAGLGALVFALHPVQVESVAWVSGLKDVGSGWFALLAIWRYLRFCKADGSPPAVRLPLLFQAGLFFLAALLAKPGTVVLPVVLLAFAKIWYRRPWRRLALELLPFFLLSLLFVAIARQAQPPRSWDFVPPLWQRLLVAGDALTFYVGKVAWPWTLGADYGRTPQAVLAHRTIWLTGLLPYPLALLLYLKASRPGQGAAALLLAFLLPVLGLLPFHFQSISTVADRYLYLAMLGPALAVGGLAAAWRSKAVWGGLLLLIALLAGKSLVQKSYWSDTLTLNDQILRVNPNSWTAYLNRGIARREQKLYQGAVDDFTKVLQYTPTEGNIYNHLGITYFNWGRNPEALAAYSKALALDPKSAGTNYNLALLYNTIGEDEQAVRYCQQALALQPDHGRAYITLGNAQLKLGRDAEAVAAFENAFRYGMALPELAFNLGSLAMKANQPGPAIEWYRRALEIDPGFGRAYNDLAAVYLQLGQIGEAISYAAKAQELGALDPALQTLLKSR